MDDDRALFQFNNGDHVTLADDNWDTAGLDIVLVTSEPVPGSSQCIVEAAGEQLVVSRNHLRLAPTPGSVKHITD